MRSKKGDFKGAELGHIGNALDTNPFDPYLHLLDRPTRTEREQAIIISELETQLIALQKERAWLKEVVMKK